MSLSLVTWTSFVVAFVVSFVALGNAVLGMRRPYRVLRSITVIYVMRHQDGLSFL